MRRMRALDLGTKEHVELLWIMEGKTYRCHRGTAFMYHDGAFQVVCVQDLRLALTVTVRIRDLNPRFGGLHVSPGLRLACFRP